MSNQLKDDGSYNEPGVILSTHMQVKTQNQIKLEQNETAFSILFDFMPFTGKQ